MKNYTQMVKLVADRALRRDAFIGGLVDERRQIMTRIAAAALGQELGLALGPSRIMLEELVEGAMDEAAWRLNGWPRNPLRPPA